MKITRWQADLLLALTALLWGGTFVAVKNAVSVLPAELIIAFRFTVAFVFLFLVFGKACRGHWRSVLLPGVFLGLILGIAFWTQTTGLCYTTPSTSAFITGLNVIFVAIIDTLIILKFPKIRVIFGTLAATAGLLVLTWSGSARFSPGDVLTLICAILFGLHIVMTSRLVRGRDPRAIVVVQFAVISVLGWLTVPLTHTAFTLSFTNVLILILLGLFPTALAFLMQTIAQKVAPPVHTAILLSLEPAFAALCSLMLGIEAPTWKLLIGGGLILAGTLLSSVEETPEEAESKIA